MSERPPGPLRPGEVLRLVLPAFAVSTVLAVVGVVLVLVGQRTIGLIVIVVAAVGGLFYRARRLMRAQQLQAPPGDDRDGEDQGF